MIADKQKLKEKSNGNNKVIPIQVTHPEHVDPKDIRLFCQPPWRLRMTIEGDRSYLRVKIVRAAPLSDPTRFICFLAPKDEVICTVEDANDLDPESRRMVQEEFEHRYMVSLVEKIHSIRSDFGVSYWDVETNRGKRDFVMQNLSENVHWLSEDRLLLIDVDGNRFEIPDIGSLDKKSTALIDLVL